MMGIIYFFFAFVLNLRDLKTQNFDYNHNNQENKYEGTNQNF